MGGGEVGHSVDRPNDVATSARAGHDAPAPVHAMDDGHDDVDRARVVDASRRAVERDERTCARPIPPFAIDVGGARTSSH